MTRAAILARLAALIDELTPVGTPDAAAVASILLATQGALLKGTHRDLSVAIWNFQDRRRPAGKAANPPVVPRRSSRGRGDSRGQSG